MEVTFTPRDTSVLYRLLAEDTTDIILKTDRKGYVLHASPGIRRLGLPLTGELIGHHIVDLFPPAFAATVRAEHDRAIAGRQAGRWIEVPALTGTGEQRWFEIQIRGLLDDADEQTSGAITVMRSIEERKALEEKLFAAAMTDPLTGLTNRQAFIAMLEHLVNGGVGGCLALFDIDHFKTINMQHGQSAGDEVLVAFSDLLRTMMRSDDIVSRIGGESLGVLLPRATPDQAEAICARVISALSELRQSAGSNGLTITASAGVARIEGSLDDTLKRAELALFFAKAKGRNRLEMDQGLRFPWDRIPKSA